MRGWLCERGRGNGGLRRGGSRRVVRGGEGWCEEVRGGARGWEKGTKESLFDSAQRSKSRPFT